VASNIYQTTRDSSAMNDMVSSMCQALGRGARGGGRAATRDADTVQRPRGDRSGGGGARGVAGRTSRGLLLTAHPAPVRRDSEAPGPRVGARRASARVPQPARGASAEGAPRDACVGVHQDSVRRAIARQVRRGSCGRVVIVTTHSKRCKTPPPPPRPPPPHPLLLHLLLLFLLLLLLFYF
jgi:hypothetical protein